jgi:hypothetical protein
MPKRVYISGAMTGKASYKNDFQNAEDHLVKQHYNVVNPAFLDDILQDAEYEEYMKVDLLLLDMCDAIYMLKDWKKSQGAVIEHYYAIKEGKEIIYEEYLN